MYLKASADVKISTFLKKNGVGEWGCGTWNGPLRSIQSCSDFIWWHCTTLIVYALNHTQHLPEHLSEVRVMWCCPMKSLEISTEHSFKKTSHKMVWVWDTTGCWVQLWREPLSMCQFQMRWLCSEKGLRLTPWVLLAFWHHCMIG